MEADGGSQVDGLQQWSPCASCQLPHAIGLGDCQQMNALILYLLPSAAYSYAEAILQLGRWLEAEREARPQMNHDASTSR